MAKRIATKPGKYSLACQSTNNSTPRMAKGPTKKPPTLCARFHIDIVVPRSLIENQCTTTRPHGGQPIPWNHPLRNRRMNMTSTEEVAKDENPMKIIVSDDNTRPRAKK